MRSVASRTQSTLTSTLTATATQHSDVRFGLGAPFFRCERGHFSGLSKLPQLRFVCVLYFWIYPGLVKSGYDGWKLQKIKLSRQKNFKLLSKISKKIFFSHEETKLA